MTSLGPRVVIAGVSSGVGKTTVATGLMAAFARRGTRVAGAKVGPDFIDPGYHALATGRPPRNLDPWLCGVDAIAPLAGRAAVGADLLIIEGVMGLFDGANDGAPSTTADVAALVRAPVVLVVDAAAMSSSVAAIVRGFRDHDPRVDLRGVILNRVASSGHERVLREALEPIGVPIVGCLRRDDRLVWRDRHLGLVPVAEQPGEISHALDLLAAAIDERFDLEAIAAIAASASPMDAGEMLLPERVGTCRIAVASGPAFTFLYEDNIEALRAAGAEIVPFDPLTATALPESIDGLLAGGGFPEVYAKQLSDNEPLRVDIRTHVAAGLPTWAECGGLLWLATEIDGAPMIGALPASARMAERLVVGYRRAELRVDTPIGPAGTKLRGHEFHYSRCDPTGDAVTLRTRFGTSTDGFATPTMLATYLHHHAGADPGPTSAFVRSCVTRARMTAR